MSIELRTKHGQIDITREVIAAIVGGAAMDCYGIVGMASQKQLKDGITELLGKDNLTKGIVVRSEDEKLHIDMYIIVSYGTKISEIAHNVQSVVKYEVNKLLGITVESINIFVQSVRVTDT